MIETTAHAVRALGLRHGPVHAELRYNGEGAWMLETPRGPSAACAPERCDSADGIPLEELILRHALGEDVSGCSWKDRPPA